jgi:glycosyltransferase involved in cell wall biosynthesis
MTRFGFLSTYPPTRCGLATFTQSLAGAIAAGGRSDARIVRVLDAPAPRQPMIIGTEPLIVADLVAGNRASIARTIAALNAVDVAVIQHEYGIYGGDDGDDVLAVASALLVPNITVLHTVLPMPTAHQKEVLESVCRLASAVVVMTEAAHSILAAGYAVDLGKVTVIPHGVALLADAPVHHDAPVKQILTWGLIGPGKGLEWSIRAMAQLADLTPAPRYTVVGQTHPKVLAHAGESYRNALTALIDELGLAGTVTLDDEYYDAERLMAAVSAADAVVLPYDSRVQVTSGVLVEAIAAGVPVVATAFPHAIELLADGAGIVVPHEDPSAIASALRTVLFETDAAERRRAAVAAVRAKSRTWSSVASEYLLLADRLLTAEAA